MESKNAILVLNQKGKNNSIFKATIPTNWLRQMDLSEDSKDTHLTFDGEQITITKNLDSET